MGYWKSRNLRLLVFLIGMLLISSSIYVINIFRIRGFITVFPVVGFVLIGGNLLHHIIRKKMSIGDNHQYLEERGISYTPAETPKIYLNKGKWTIYLVGFVFTILSIVISIDDYITIKVILLVLYAIYCILVVFLDAKWTTKHEKILIGSSYILHVFIVLVLNVRIASGITIIWLVYSIVVVIRTFIIVYQKNNREHLSRLIPIIAGYICYIAIVKDDFYVFNHVGIKALICSIVLLITILIQYVVYKKEPVLKTPTGYFVSMTVFPVIIGLLMSYAILQLNFGFDFRGINTEVVEILEKDTYIYNERENYYFVYDFYEEDRVYLKEDEYNAINVGDTFNVHYYEGLFGIKYYVLDENHYILDRQHDK